MLKTRKDWELQREAALKNPGKFHGDIAKREIYWFDAATSCWMKIQGQRIF